VCAWPATARADVGDGANGLPSIGRVAVAEPKDPHATVAGGVGYGFTEGPHHRALGTIAGAVQPLRFLSAALMFNGRWDSHPDDALGSSSTAVGEQRLFLRVAESLGKGFSAGGQVVVWVPGGEAPSLKFDATTVDANLLATWAPAGLDLAMALNAGYRVDNSAAVVDAPRRLRPGDRLTLALSDYDAFLLGLGASKRIGKLELLGDVSWDVLLGGPSAIESPLRVGAGGRWHMTDTLAAELHPEVVVSERAPQGPNLPFVPIEPRFTITLGLRWTLPFGKPPPKETAPVNETPVAPQRVAAGSIRGKVTNDKGGTVPGVRVSVGALAVDAAADGSFDVENVPAGQAHVVARAAGYEDASADTTVEDHGIANVTLAMKRMIKPGVLKGLVRSFNGKPLAATVRVEPLGVETKTDAEGTFTIEVPPGAYEIVVAAPGHAGQRRPVQVEENGVTVLNADLRQGP
jgi:hypothetical protein